MTNKITEMKDFEQLKQIIFKKLQEEIKEVNAFRLTGVFEVFEKKSKEYNEYYYFFNTSWNYISYADENISKYKYTVEDIKKLMIKLATGLTTNEKDIALLNNILDRRRKQLSFSELFNIDDLIKRTQELKNEYYSMSKLKRWWMDQ